MSIGLPNIGDHATGVPVEELKWVINEEYFRAVRVHRFIQVDEWRGHADVVEAIIREHELRSLMIVDWDQVGKLGKTFAKAIPEDHGVVGRKGLYLLAMVVVGLILYLLKVMLGITYDFVAEI